MPGLDEQVYEAACARMDGYTQAMKQVSEQCKEQPLVSMLGEVTAVGVIYKMVTSRFLEEVEGHDGRAAALADKVAEVAERIIEELEELAELQKLEGEGGPH